MKAYAPDGETPIVSTVETLLGTCGTEPDSFERDDKGKLTWDWDSNGTKIDWDSAETDTTDNQAIFLDQDGNQWLEDDLILKESDD